MSQPPALVIDDAPFTPPSGPVSSKDFEREMAQSPGSSSAFSLRPQRPSPRPSPIISPSKPPLSSSNAASTTSAGPPITPIPFSPVRSVSYRQREREKERDKERDKDNSEEFRVKERRDRRERERKDRKDRRDRKPSEESSGRRGERSDRWGDRSTGASSATKLFTNDKESNDEDEEEEEESGRGSTDTRKDGPIEYHPLDDSWTFWFDRRLTFRKTDKEKDKADKDKIEKGYESNLKEVGRFNNVEYFWRYFHHMQKPSALEFNSNYHLFRTGIKPMWEDPENARGGKWLIRLSQRDRHHLNAIWQNIVLGLIGEVSEEMDDVCGAVLSRRRPGDRIAVWHRHNTDQDALQRLGTKLKDILSDGINGLGNVQMEYSTHEEALKQATAPKWQK